MRKRTKHFTFFAILALTTISLFAEQLHAATPAPVAPKYVKTRLGTTQRIPGPMNAPRVTRRVYPRYPAEARRARTQGLVYLEVLIDPAGKVADITVTKGLPHGLTEAVTTAVRQWVFQPVVDAQGKTVPALIDVVFSFRH